MIRTALCLVALGLVPISLAQGGLFKPRPGGLLNQPGSGLGSGGLLKPRPGGLFAPPNLKQVPTPSVSIATVDAADKCAPPQKCTPDEPFRTLDGGCNNLVFPMWGQAGTALSRIAPAEYQDGVNEPRKAKSGSDLPNVRDIVVRAFGLIEKVDNINTLALMSVGQLVSHDGSLIAASPDPPDTCCTKGGSNCMNIAVSPRDPFYRQFNVTCLPMTRAPTTASIKCALKPEYTLTEVSHFIDASFVYGSTKQQAEALREKVKGRLKEERIKGHSFPPHNSDAGTCFSLKLEDFCMNAGDTRANQNPPLGALQVIFFREHNRIAFELALLNPEWDDERLYQESRRILIAEWQIIVYRDYLPLIIGPDVALSQNLIPDLVLMRTDYDEFLNPSTTNDFTSAAFRVFHSQIPDAYCAVGKLDKAPGCPFGASRFSNTFDNPQVLTSEGGFDSILFGLDRQNGDKVDDTFSIEVAGKLFRHGKPWGHDLISTDILRGRDVGLPSYNTYRSVCGLRPARRWRQLADSFSPKDFDKLRSLYESPDDIDVYVAGVLEKKFGKALVGPIFECILVDQFKRWMKGDRYFVDFKGFKHSFTPLQAKALASTSLARLFCDNGDDVKEIPRDIFLLLSELVPCDTIPRVDLTPWISPKPVLK